MRTTVTIAAVTLTTLAFAASPAAGAEPRVDGSAGCAEAGQFRNFIATNFGRAAVGTFISNDARMNGPRAVADGTNGFKAAFCS